ncbi:peptidylprolyl isomerase [Altericroceibacterium spongiae]|uniref:Parvulin-like PPIase n=2 Tax=Altericroceibacterium spongiae TaxID=2320269 RepID=A0A420ESC1_9SPHN|nr:peptidylprolyl isomerase [Altericroceibacterium spongiae]
MLGNSDPNVRRATATVNGAVITGTDVDQRLALILAANEQKISPEEEQRLRLQILRNLIDETLQIQEAAAQEMTVTQDEVDQTYNRLATQRFGRTPEEMKTYLASIGSSPASLKRQIEGELAWDRLLSRNVEPFINVASEEVDDLYDRLQESRGTAEYRLGEIYLSATPANKQQVFNNARQIVEQLQQGGSFVGYARQYSEASTAAVGGDLGWIRLAQLQNPQLETVAKDMSPGQLVGPIEIPGGFSILYLIDKRQVGMADPRDAVMSLKQISITLAKDATQAQAKAKVDAFSKAVDAIRGCGEADAAAAKIGADVVTNDQIRVRSLPDALQQALLKLNVGEATPPFGSVEEGVRVLMLCGRDDPQVDSGPTRDQLMNQMENERVNRRAQRYLRDLRRDAVIDYN